MDAVPGPPEGIVVVDKPAGWTSHDVVSRMRRLAGTRRVGHAGTLDPMATGVLVVGIGRATRLLGYISGSDKTYSGTIRLGWSTVTDDAQGQPLEGRPADQVPLADLVSAVGDLTGAIMQRPSAVSAIKVDGRRSHDRVRSGEDVELPARPVVVSDFEVLEIRRLAELAATDLDVVVTCSSGTYIRALARDLGAALAVGGHLTSLRRLRVGGFELDRARSLEELAVHLEVIDMPTVARMAFPSLVLNAADANAVRYGRPIELGNTWAHAHQPSTPKPQSSAASAPGDATLSTPPAAEQAQPPYALLATDGEFLALAERRPDGSTRYLAVFAQPE